MIPTITRPKKRLLLISNSTMVGGEYLEHCANEIAATVGNGRRLVFVPFALCDHVTYTSRVRAALARTGITVDSLAEASDPRKAVLSAEALFVGGGNTFVLLKALYDQGLLEPIRWRVFDGMPYVGTSAGTNVAGLTIQTTNDMPILYPPSLRALELVDFNVNPHYMDTALGSSETREGRIRQFHQYNEPPVIGLREGGSLHVHGTSVVVKGGARLFRRNLEPMDLAEATDVSDLLVGGIL